MNELTIVDPRSGTRYRIQVPEGFTIPEDPAARANALSNLRTMGLMTPVEDTPPSAEAAPEAAGPGARALADRIAARPPSGPGDAAAGPGAPGTTPAADDLARPVPAPDTGDTVEARRAGVAEGRPLFRDFTEPGPEPDPVMTFDEAVAAYEAEFGPLDFGDVPSGAAVNLPNGITVYPNEEIWHRTNEGMTEEQLLTERVAAELRSQLTGEGGAYGFTENPLVSGATTGLSYGLADEMLGLADPVAGAALRQIYEQNLEEHPYQTIGGEVAGAIGSGITGAGAATRAPGMVGRGARAASEAVAALPRIGQAAVAAPTAIAATAAYEGAVAPPGERMDRAFDPTTAAIAGTMAGAFPYVAPAVAGRVNRLFNSSSPATPEAPVALPNTLSAEVQEYMRGISPLTSPAERIRAGDAALELGVDLPMGIVSDPERYSRAANDPVSRTVLGMFGTNPAQAERNLTEQISERFGDIVTQGRNVAPSHPGEAGDRLLASIDTNLSRQIAQMGREYDQFKVEFAGNYELPPNISESLDDVFSRRFDAGSESDEDAAFLGEVANLVNRNIREEVDPEDMGDLADLPGVTFQGLQDARSMLRARTADFKRLGQRDPKKNDIQTMETALTDAINDIIRTNSPDDLADQRVAEFLDLDHQYAIANDALRDIRDRFSGESTSVMNTLGKALSTGGQTSISTVKRIQENASKEAWDNAKAVLLHQMGADDIGQFDVTKFANSWTGVSSDVRDVIFDRGHAADLNRIATIGRTVGALPPPDVSQGMFNSRNLFDIAAFSLGGWAVGTSSIVQRIFSARSLTNPLTAKRLSKIYENLDDVSKAQTDSARALGMVRLNRAIQDAAADPPAGVPPVNLNSIPGSDATSETSRRNVVGTVGR